VVATAVVCFDVADFAMLDALVFPEAFSWCLNVPAAPETLSVPESSILQ